MDRYQFDPAEAAWIAYLLGEGHDAYAEVPDQDRPPRFIEVERTGGAPGLATDDAQMTFRCWAPSRAEADAYAAEIHRLVLLARELAGRHVTAKRTIGSPVYFPDEPTRGHRYQFTIRAKIRGRYPDTPAP
ncbi:MULTISPECIES: hypothetical protein [unclassified Leucobacter]|uniref:hypothetical protein n=1 Tax=unclassified Leucobacter TaxID=2621730 RepID=UPI00062265A0|nr:hypothetical protein [Leucobacter sp. Ag1]KKI20558.1 hypothetical protein XM48_07510 [Leucobacter sp. Ag1]